MERLVAALGYEDPVVARDGQVVDLGADVREAAVHALAGLDGAEADSGLMRALSDPEPSVRLAAVQAVGHRGAPAWSEALIRVALGWKQPELAQARKVAVSALIAFDEPAAAAAFAQALLEMPREPDEEDVEALRRFGREAVPDTLHLIVETLMARLRDDGMAERAAGLLALLAPDSVPPLVAALDDARTKHHAAMALGSARDSRAVVPLRSLLMTSDDPAIRRISAWALGEIRDPAAAEALFRATGDSDYAVRAEAGKGFDKLGNAAVAMALGAVVRQALSVAAAPAPTQVEAGGSPAQVEAEGGSSPAEVTLAVDPPAPLVPRIAPGAPVRPLERLWRRAVRRRSRG